MFGVHPADRVAHEIFERLDVLRKLADHVVNFHPAAHVDTGVQVGHQSNGRIADFELAGQHRLRVTGHVDQREAGGGEPLTFRAGGKSRPLDDDHGAAVDHLGQAGDRRAQRRAIRVGEGHVRRAGVEVGVGATTSPVYQLIGHHDGARAVVSRQAADRARGEDLPHSQLAQCPHVGPIGHLVRRKPVVGAVPGQECHLVLADRADRDRGTGFAVGRVQVDAARGRVEEGVEAAAANHSEHLRHSSSSLRIPQAGGAPTAPSVGGHGDHSCARACNDRGVASLAQWIAGARPRTLPNAIAPVIAGTGAAAWLHSAVWWKALLALAVALALIVGVNFANDYSDGIRGTDDNRAGPVRLVGSRLATPRAVLTVALTSLAVGAAAGLVLALTSAPWLIAVGALCIAGAWLYTGGSKPYGYAGLGEVAVFLFFGLVAVLGTQYTQALRVDWVGLALAVTTGALSSAVLVANNLRDIPTDGESGKITLAVRLGDKRTRILYQVLLAVAAVLTLALTAATPWCAAGLVATPLAVRAAAPVRTGRAGPELIPVLRDTGLTMLGWSIAVAAALTLTA